MQSSTRTRSTAGRPRSFLRRDRRSTARWSRADEQFARARACRRSRTTKRTTRRECRGHNPSSGVCVPAWAMTTDRRFSRFSKSPATAAFSVTEIPEEGVCLSAFLIVTEAHDPKRVLMGHMNPKAPWDHIGALDPSRVEAHSRGWMLPSSHLIFRESPDEAARRIAREQLELPDLALSGPNVVSEVYTPKRFPGTAHHWDIEFLFRGQLAATDAPHPSAWTELAFVDLRRTSKAEIARSHEDVIESAGLRFGDG